METSELTAPSSEYDAYNELMQYDEKQAIINELLATIRKVHAESLRANRKGFNLTFKYVDQEFGKYILGE